MSHIQYLYFQNSTWLILVILLIFEIRSINQKYRSASKVANYDGLTGLLRREMFEDKVQFLMSLLPNDIRRRKNTSNHGIAFLLIDIDLFKSVNDKFGHLEGDNVLRCVAMIIKNTLRNDDLICRWGGEEFLVALPNVFSNEAIDLHWSKGDITLLNKEVKSVAEKLRLAVETQTLGFLQPVTVSVGVSYCLSQSSCKGQIETADKALYQAKENGRNQVILK